MGAMYLTADGAKQDEAIGQLPTLPYPVGPNQYTPVTMLTLAPPNYDVQVRHHAKGGISFVSRTHNQSMTDEPRFWMSKPSVMIICRNDMASGKLRRIAASATQDAIYSNS